MPNEPVIVVANHSQAQGPLLAALRYPRPKGIWCIGEMLNAREVPQYAYEDFWRQKPIMIRWFFKLLSYIIAIPASYALKHSDTIPVYKDSRIITTFKKTVENLKEGNDVIIFPEWRTEHNEIINELQDKFVDVARLYYKTTGKKIKFVPMYHAANLKKVVFGNPIEFDPTLDMNLQRKLICNHIKDEITRVAKDLPRHKVIPYNNISKKNYPYSK